MKNLMTTQNLIIAGLGLATAYVVYNVLVNKDKNAPKTKELIKADEKSDFCGCGM